MFCVEALWCINSMHEFSAHTSILPMSKTSINVEFRDLVLDRLKHQRRTNTLTLGFIFSPPAIIRQDAGASARAQLAVELGEHIIKDTCTLQEENKYHKFNTQYIGTNDGLQAYESFIKHGPDFVDDHQATMWLRAQGAKVVLHVEHGIVAGFKACHQCGIRSDDSACENCVMRCKRICSKCNKTDDVRRMEGNTCRDCHMKEIVYCGTCNKDEPRGHTCILPILMVPVIPHKRGRPHARKYVELVKGKKHVLCTLGCKPGTCILDRSWKRHVDRKHSGTKKRFKCRHKGCRYACNDINQFNRHKLTHSTKKTFVCEYCNASFKQREGMSAHKKRTHPQYIAKKHFNATIVF